MLFFLPNRLSVSDATAYDFHAGTLVQPDCPGRVLGVHPEADPGLSSRPQLTKRVPKQRETQPATAPGLPHAQHRDPTEGRIAFPLRTAENDALQLAVRFREKPQSRVKSIAERPVAPVVVRERRMVVEVRERFLLDLVDRAGVLAAKLPHGDPFRPRGLGLVVERGRHPEREPVEDEAARLERLPQLHRLLGDRSSDAATGRGELGGTSLDEVEQWRPGA